MFWVYMGLLQGFGDSGLVRSSGVLDQAAVYIAIEESSTLSKQHMRKQSSFLCGSQEVLTDLTGRAFLCFRT